MRGFETGDDIDLWPGWRAEDGKAKGVRATLVDWDDNGVTIALEREPGTWSFIPWCQVRMIRKAISRSDAARNSGPPATFAWNRATEENAGSP